MDDVVSGIRNIVADEKLSNIDSPNKAIVFVNPTTTNIKLVIGPREQHITVPTRMDKITEVIEMIKAEGAIVEVIECEI